MESLTTTDLEAYLTDPTSDRARLDCKQVAEDLEQRGLTLVRDARVNDTVRVSYLSMMDQFWKLPEEKKLEYVRAETMHQMGYTPPRTERPGRSQERIEIVNKMAPWNRPYSNMDPRALNLGDSKVRWFHAPVYRESSLQYAWFNRMDNQAPEGFPQWLALSDLWGQMLHATAMTILEMAALGWGSEDPKLFTRMLHLGPHLLAPTGSDLIKHGTPKEVLAGFHNDTGCLTVHGKATHPGLRAWTRDSRVFDVKVPQGCVLAQAGRQFEWLTGGRALRGFHEVVVADQKQLQDEIAEAKRLGRQLFRTATPMFLHVQSDKTVEPIGPFVTEQSRAKYEPFVSGARLLKAVKARGLAPP